MKTFNQFVLLAVLALTSLSLHAQDGTGKLDADVPSPACVDDKSCDCDGAFTEMQLYYFGEDNVTVNVYRNSNGTILIATFNNVNSGDLLTVDASGTLNGSFAFYTYFEIENAMGDACTTRIFSRCPSNSWPGALEDQRVLGETFGDFTVFSHTDVDASTCTVANIEQDWRVGGNVLAEDGRLGSRTNEDVVLITNDQARGVLTNTGNLGLNTMTPGALLDVDGDAIVNENLDVNGIARANAVVGSANTTSGALIVAGGVGVAENVNLGNNLDVGQNGRIGNDLGVGNDAEIGRDLTVTRNTSTGQNLSVGNDATVGNDLGVTNNANVGQDASVGRDLTVGRNANIALDAEVGNDLIVWQNASTGQELTVGTNATINDNLLVGADAQVANELLVGNTAVIGTEPLPAGYRLGVDGNVICEEVLVELSENWPDYVFADEYERPNIREWQLYIAQNRHLPGIPSAAEVAAQGGFELGETNRLLLEKIEQLTLIIIDQQAQLDALETRLNERK